MQLHRLHRLKAGPGCVVLWCPATRHTVCSESWMQSLLHTLAQDWSLTPKRRKSFTSPQIRRRPQLFTSAGINLTSLNSSRTWESIITSTCDLIAEIQHRVNLASASFGRLSKRVFRNRDLSTRTKMAVYNGICVSTLLYACEGWTLYHRHIRALAAFHIRCFQIILHVHWWDKIPHLEFCRRAGTTSPEPILLRRQLR